MGWDSTYEKAADIKAAIRGYENGPLSEAKRIESEWAEVEARVRREVAVQRILDDVESRRGEWEPVLRELGLPVD